VTASKQPVQTPRKRATKSVRRLPDEPVAEMGLAGQSAQPETDGEALTGEFIGKATESRALVSLLDEPVPDEDEEVIKRVEHLNHSVGWLLVSAGLVGMIVPGVLGTPFLIMGGLVLWPGNHNKVERWRKGHSPKVFHGAMKQINRFLDDLEKRYPHIDKP